MAGWPATYLRRVGQAIRHTPRWMVAFIALVVLAGYLYVRLPTSFLPEEDQGYAFAIIQLPPGATMQRTTAVLQEMEAILKKNPIVDRVLMVAGFSFVGQGENVGLGFIRLKDWSERTRPGRADQGLHPGRQWRPAGGQGGAHLRRQHADGARARTLRRLRLPPAGPRRSGP